MVQYVEHNLLLLVTSTSDLPLHTIKCCSDIVFGVYHSGFLSWTLHPVISRHQQTPLLLAAISVTNLPRSGSTMLITPSRSQHWQHVMKQNIGQESQFLTTPLYLTFLLERMQKLCTTSTSATNYTCWTNEQYR